MQNKIYRVLQNDEVVAIFNRKDYANDFIDYQNSYLTNQGNLLYLN